MKTNGTLQIIYGTAAELQAMDPVLRPDQAGVELSADEIPVLLRFGDGAKAWNDLVEGQLYIGSGGGGITALTGDVTASGTGSVAATLATVGPGAGAIAYPASITLDANGRVKDATAGTPPAIPLDAMWAQILNAGAPAAGEVEANSDADATAVTSITFHKTDAGTNDQSAWFTQMRIGGNLTVRMTNNDGTNASGTPVVYRITAVPTLASDRYTIAVAYVSGQFIGTSPNWYVSYAGNGPKVYTGILNQTGTDAPVATFVTDELGITNFTYVDVGEYRLNGTGLFPEGTRVFLSNGSRAVTGAQRGTDDRIEIFTADADGSPADAVLFNASIRVEVPV